MNIKVIYSSGGKYNKNPDQKIADAETVEGANLIVEELTKNGHVAEIIKVTPKKIDEVKEIQADAIFNLVEWSGKDYPMAVRVLKHLETCQIPYTGADSNSYEWCCDKIAMKKMFDKFGIPTPAWTFVEMKDSAEKIMEKIEKLKFPIIIKPAYEHCAIGIDSKSVIQKKKGAVKKIQRLISVYKEPAIVEEFIKGREFTATLVKNHKLHAFPPAEIKFKSNEKFLSFKSQWIDKNVPYKSVVLKDKELSVSFKKLAKKIFMKMGCKGYVRIDARFNGKKIHILEININPSLIPDSHYGLTVSTKAAGWSFNKLINEIASSAINHQI